MMVHSSACTGRAAWLCLWLAGTAMGQQAAAPDAPLKVIVSIPPQAAIVEALGGPRVAVETLVRAGQSPHVYEPTPQQIARLSDARLIVRIGMPFEAALAEKLIDSNAKLNSVDMRAGVRLLDAHGHVCEEHGHDHAHEVNAADPHFWLDPKRMKGAARTITDALTRVDPAGAAEFARRLAETLDRLEQIDRRLSDLLAPSRGRAFFVYHAAYGYFADSYGLRQIAVESAGKEPTPKEIANLVELARKEKAKVIFIEPQFSRASVELLAKEIDARVAEINDLAPDYFENLERVGRQIAEALK